MNEWLRHGTLNAVNELETLIDDWLTLPDVSERLELPINKVHSLLDERALVAVRIGERKIRCVPSEFLIDGHVLENLKGTVIVLSDAGYDDEEMLRWLFTADDSLPGRPIDALRAGRKREIRRRAQALAW
ncbi:Rv2175c family DNA-binding protein [Arthrobacter castelli]|uniref:Rv2175c family DNA-binding protein n=1 Tax=Arthrobacter castelli TaxID=271431 RepID=UPI003CCBAEDD